MADRHLGLFLLVSLFLTGCQSVGPATIRRDQFDYNRAISTSHKEQLLLNMVRLRYGEAPLFLSVASVIAQYSVEGQLAVNAPGYDRPNNVGPAIASGAARFSDRPTITYQPLNGAQLASILLAPVPLQAAFSLVQSGWPVDLTLKSTVRTLNGMGAYSGEGGIRWNQDFLSGIDAIAETNRSGAARVRLEGDRIYYVLNTDPDPAQRAAIEHLRAALALDPAAEEYELVISAYAGMDRQITLTMASVLDILNVLAAQFEVPEEHVAAGWTFSTPVQQSTRHASVRVRCGTEEPQTAFVATFDRGHWFWIDEHDYPAKRAFSFLTMLMTLAESGAAAAPMVTIGTGGN